MYSSVTEVPPSDDISTQWLLWCLRVMVHITKVPPSDGIYTQVSLKYLPANVDVPKCHCSASLASCIYSRITLVPHRDDIHTQD